MLRRSLVLIPLTAVLPTARALSLTEGDANSGIRAALNRGAEVAVGLLGKQGGFMNNPAVRIELPGHLKDAAKLLKATGQGKRLDELVATMNRAAEQAVPAAMPLLKQAVRDMSVEDGLKILRGGDDSVTQFFAGKTRAPLTERFLPVVTAETEKLSLADKYNAVASKGVGLGLVKGDEANLQQYVTGKALDALYRIIGEEEKKIRKDPVGTGSAILKKVFGGLG